MPLSAIGRLTRRTLPHDHYHPRVLEAWVDRHIPSVRETFQKKSIVRERTIQIPVPVVLDGAVIADPTGEHLRSTFATKRCCLLIWGEGGAGKTSLACQMARWAMAEHETDCLCEHRMLPVLDEPDNRTAHRDAKVLAWECLRQTYRPASIRRDTAITVLGGGDGD